MFGESMFKNKLWMEYREVLTALSLVILILWDDLTSLINLRNTPISWRINNKGQIVLQAHTLRNKIWKLNLERLIK